MGGYDLSKIGKVTVLSVSLLVGRSVGRSVSQLVRKKEKSVFPVTGRVVISMYIIEGRRKKAEGSINIGNAKTVGDVQSTPPHYNLSSECITKPYSRNYGRLIIRLGI